VNGPVNQALAVVNVRLRPRGATSTWGDRQLRDAGDVREAARRVRGDVVARRREPPPSPAGASWTPAARKFSDLHHPRQSTRLWSARHRPRPSRIWFRD